MKTTHIVAWLIASLVGISGCNSLPEHLRPPSFALSDKNLTSQGPKPLVEKEVFEQINLVTLLDPEEKDLVETVQKNGKLEQEKVDITKLGDVRKLRRYIDKAIWRFDMEPLSSDQKVARRNSIQETILAASRQSCSEYKKFLRQFEAEGNFFLGVATTVLGGLGAIFTPAATVRALSGSAAITSGVRAEFQEDFFQRLATHVITAGIDVKRDDIYRAIRERQKEPYASYPVAAAVGDAVTYHSACSTIVGLQAASDAVEQAQDPGLKRLKTVGKELGFKFPSDLDLSPSAAVVVVNGKRKFRGLGGQGEAYSFAIATDTSGGATITVDPSEKGVGQYVAGPNPGNTIVIITDGVSVAHARVVVNPLLAVKPASPTVQLSDKTVKLSAEGGIPPYRYELVKGADTTGGAEINADNGTYMAGPHTGQSVVRVTDMDGNTKDVTVAVTAAAQ